MTKATCGCMCKTLTLQLLGCVLIVFIVVLSVVCVCVYHVISLQQIFMCACTPWNLVDPQTLQVTQYVPSMKACVLKNVHIMLWRFLVFIVESIFVSKCMLQCCHNDIQG